VHDRRCVLSDGRLKVRERSRRFVAEALGTGLLIVAVIGSGIMAERLSPADVGLQLLENAAAAGAALIALILIFGAVSGAHFNPAVTLVARVHGITTADAGAYVVAQILGGCAGAMLANLMFDLHAIELSTQTRSSGALWLSEVVATAGLMLVIFGCIRTGRGNAAPYRSRIVDRWRVLVHVLDRFRQPRRHNRPHTLEHLRRNQTSSVPMFIVMQLIGTAVGLALVSVRYVTPRPAIEHV
jgi:glycerol uptake facilitator-like aquaporin